MSSNRNQKIDRYEQARAEHNGSKKGSILTIKSEQEPVRHRPGAQSSKGKMNHQLLAQTQGRPKERSIALERWKILKDAILNKSRSYQNSAASVRRFDSFGFIKCVKIAYDPSLNAKYSKYHAKGSNSHRFYSSNAKNSNFEVDVSESDDDDDDVCIDRAVVKSNKGNHSQKNTDAENFEWFNISVPTIDAMDLIKVRFYKGPIGLNDLMGFNNTGNVCLWPSEEIMTYFCIKNSAIFDNKSVCELGGGMTCLGGLMISRYSQPNEVFLTDGNEASFENLEVICSDNDFRCSVECCLLQWSRETNYGDLENRFDYIICADCLFFDEFREDLCSTIWKLLKMDGTCLIFAPNRQNTFHKFVDMAKLHFECMIVHDYDMEVWERHLHEKENNPNYDEDLHYPLLLKLKKRKRTTNDFCKMVL